MQEVQFDLNFRYNEEVFNISISMYKYVPIIPSFFSSFNSFVPTLDKLF